MYLILLIINQRVALMDVLHEIHTDSEIAFMGYSMIFNAMVP